MESLVRAAVFDIHAKYRTTLAPLPTQTAPVLGTLEGIKAVLFDIYGTLLVSGSGDVGTAVALSRKEAFRNAIICSGIHDPADELVKTTEELFFAEIANRHAISHDRGIRYPEVDIVSVWDSVLRGLSLRPSEEECIRAAVGYEVIANPVCLMPGARTAIEQLRKAGFLLGIISNAQSYTRPLLEYELGSSLTKTGFDISLCSYSFRVGEAKPSAAIFRPVTEYLSDTYGIRPSQIIYIGNDMLNDIYTASKLGLLTCLFAGDQRSLRLRTEHELCSGLRPDAIVCELTQIVRVVSP